MNSNLPFADSIRLSSVLVSLLLLLADGSSGQPQPLYGEDPLEWRLVFPGLPDDYADSIQPWGIHTSSGANPKLAITANISRLGNATLSSLPAIQGLSTPQDVGSGFELRIPSNGTGNCANTTLGHADNAQFSVNCFLTLGPNSELVPSFNNTISPSHYSWPTLPFSLTLGNSSEAARPGFIGFGGVFDANASMGDQWLLLPETAAPGSTFLTTGRQELPSAQLLNYQHQVVPNNYKIIIDFNQPDLEFGGLESYISCMTAFGIRFTQSSGVISSGKDTDIMLGQNTSSLDGPFEQYYACTESATDGIMVLGWPFFQAAMIYVNETGAVYVTQASQQKGSPNWQLFNPNNLTLNSTADKTASAANMVSLCDRQTVVLVVMVMALNVFFYRNVTCFRAFV